MAKITLKLSQANIELAAKNLPAAWTTNPEQPSTPTAQDNLTKYLTDTVTAMVKEGKRQEYEQSLNTEIAKLDNSVSAEGVQ